MQVLLNPNSVASYDLFLRIKKLPQYKIVGRMAWYPDEYNHLLGMDAPVSVDVRAHRPVAGLFDYQRDVSKLAIRKKKFCTFIAPGYGKTLIYFEFARHVARVLPPDKCILMVAPLMVVEQTMDECRKWYTEKQLPMIQVRAAGLREWLLSGKERVGITNYEAITEDLEQGRLGCLMPDESSCMKSHYGKWGAKIIELGRGLEWKLAGTGTPAPNDRIEYANHAVFMDAFPNVNSFLAKFFINRGETGERWEMKAHALKAFYRSLSHWSIFMSNPATFGWKDNVASIPPTHIHIHDVDLTEEQQALVMRKTGTLFAGNIGGITSRTELSQIAKGNYKGTEIGTNKPAFIKSLVDSWPEESTIIWCRFNLEQERLERMFAGAASIEGDTPYEQRKILLDDFKAGRRKVLISKPKCLGFGLNLQVATRHIFSSCEDSWEEFQQAIKRSNRVGSTKELNVHLPVTDAERPMMENVLRKAARNQQDTSEQEALFKETAGEFLRN